MAFPLKLRGSQVCVRHLTKKEEKVGAIVITNADRNQEITEALVMATGPANDDPKVGIIEPGQKVLVNHQTDVGAGPGGLKKFRPRGLEFKWDGETYFLYDHHQILAVLVEPKTVLHA